MFVEMHAIVPSRAHLKQTVSTLQEQLDRARQDGNNVRQQLLEAKQSDGRRLKEVEKYVSQDVMNGLAVVQLLVILVGFCIVTR